jgi:hypothetical protein
MNLLTLIRRSVLKCGTKEWHKEGFRYGPAGGSIKGAN